MLGANLTQSLVQRTNDACVDFIQPCILGLHGATHNRICIPTPNIIVEELSKLRFQVAVVGRDFNKLVASVLDLIVLGLQESRTLFVVILDLLVEVKLLLLQVPDLLLKLKALDLSVIGSLLGLNDCIGITNYVVKQLLLALNLLDLLFIISDLIILDALDFLLLAVNLVGNFTKLRSIAVNLVLPELDFCITLRLEKAHTVFGICNLVARQLQTNVIPVNNYLTLVLKGFDLLVEQFKLFANLLSALVKQLVLFLDLLFKSAALVTKHIAICIQLRKTVIERVERILKTLTLQLGSIFCLLRTRLGHCARGCTHVTRSQRLSKVKLTALLIGDHFIDIRNALKSINLFVDLVDLILN